MNIDQFHRQREELDLRVQRLSKSVEESRAETAADAAARGLDMTRRLFDEIGVALEELAVAETELREFNEELLVSREECEHERSKYRDLFDFCPDAYIVSDLEGNVREANLAAGKLLGLRAEYLCNKPLLPFVAKEHRDQAHRRLLDLVERARAVGHRPERPVRIESWEVQLQNRAGRPFIGSITAQAAFDPQGRPEFIRWMIRDVSKQKESEAALEAMREQLRRSEQLTAIGTLAAGLGHDVKNLLFPLRMRLDALAAQPLTQEAQQDIEVVREAIRYLQQLAANLQMLAEKHDSGADPRVGRPTTHLPSWWEHIYPLLAASLRKRVTLSIRFEPDTPPVAIAPHLLTQVIVNLVNNAGRALGDEGHITVWAETGAAADDFVRLGVSDDGPGMEASEVKRILDPRAKFVRATHALSTGMGLPLVRSIVEQAGGALEINAKPGSGTTVAFTLPAAAKSDDTGDSESNGPYAAVSLIDGHIASSMCTLLNLSRLPARRTPPSAPGDCSIWITEPDLVSPTQAREYLESGEKRRLVMLGSADVAGKEWREVPAVWIKRPASPRIIRNALSEVVHEVLHG